MTIDIPVGADVGPEPASRTQVPPAPGGAVAPAGAPLNVGRRRWEFMHFAVRNQKLMLGLSVETFFVLLAIFGPVIAPYSTARFIAPAMLHPSAKHLLGTTYFGEDVLSQVLNALRDSYLVGLMGALCAGVVGLFIGFTAGWRGGVLDEILTLFTNIVIMVPALVLLIVIGAYEKTHSVVFEALFIGLTTWPWVARAVRAQTFTLRERDFVDLARLSGKRGASIVVKDIAPNMASYLFLVFILLFAGSMLVAVSYDFLGLGPTNTISLGDMMNSAMLWSALDLKLWWWFIPPGAIMTLMVAALYIANVGLDEVFNPKLRDR